MNIKRFLSLALALLLVLSCVPMQAQAAAVASGTCGANLTWVLNDAGVLTISGEGPMTDYAQNGDQPWFNHGSKIKTVVIQEGVTSIGSYAFYQRTSLTDVTIPDSVTTIGTRAFYGCTALEELTFGNHLESIGEAAFMLCSKLTEVVIPDSVTSIGKQAFASCSGMTGLVIGNGLTVIDEDTFKSCRMLISATIGSGVTSIGRNAFASCSALETVNFGGNETVIGESAFSSCSVLNNVKLPQTLTSIGSRAFSHCSALKEIAIPDSVTELGSHAFLSCEALTSVNLGNGVTALNQQTFSSCSALSNVTMGSGVTYIDKYVFEFCNALTDLVLGEGVVTIGGYAFATCKNLARITIPVSVTTIEDSAFLWCHALEDAYYNGTKAQWDQISIAGYNGSLLSANLHFAEPEAEEINREAGSNRFDTANKVADQMKEAMGVEQFDAVILANGYNFADALAGSYLSAMKKAPILLTWNGAEKYNYLNDATIEYVKANLKPGGTVYILGGTSAVPAFIDEALSEFVIKRMDGANRFETNLMILEEAGIADGTEILVCTATNFADSLSASAAGKPILLVFNESGKLYGDQPAFLEGLKNCTFTVIGGESAVSAKLADAVGKYGTVTRLAGKNRFETSVLVAEKYFPEATSAVLAYAWDFPDGLCGGGLAYAMQAPLILTMTKYETQAADYIQSQGIKGGIVLGGEGLISAASVEKIFGN